MARNTKMAALRAVIDGTHCMGEDGLRNYHAARAAINSCRCRDPFRKLAAVKAALHAYRVVVTLGPVGEVLVRDFATGKSAVL